MCVLRRKVLQRLLVVAAVDAAAVDLQDDLARLEPRSRRLPACNVRQETQGSEVRGQHFLCGFCSRAHLPFLFQQEKRGGNDFLSAAPLHIFCRAT